MLRGGVRCGPLDWKYLVQVFLMGEHSVFFCFFFAGGAGTLSMVFLLWRSEGLFN